MLISGTNLQGVAMLRYHNDHFTRYPGNPIITFDSMPYRCHAVFNPGAVLAGDETILLLRVEDLEGASHITIARSRDGVTGWTIDPKPLLSPNHDHGGSYEEYGCEDPRVTYLDDIGKWIIAYTAYSPMGAGVALALTSDFVTVERLGLTLAPNNKDAAVFPGKIGGKYWMLHRPAAGEIEHIWVTDSPDLRHWGHPTMLLNERGGPWWDSLKVGASTIPIRTDQGWLILYHGVKNFPVGPAYRLGAPLEHLQNPRRLIARLPYWILAPREYYETTGQVPNVVFPCGHTLVGDELRLYYGAADTCVCLASGSLQEILCSLMEHPV